MGAQFGGAGDQLCQSVAMDSAGNVIIAGGYNGTLQFGALAAFPTVSGSTSSLLYVATLDGVTGTPTAASTWGTAGKVSPFGITVDASNNIIVAGSLGANVSFGATAGTITDLGLTDAFVVKMSVSAPTLSPIWAKSFGDATFDQQAKSVATSSNGDVYLAGLFVGTMGAMNLSSFGNTTTDGFVAHLSGQDGSVLCAQRYGDTSGIQEVDAITVARAASGALLDNVAVGGAFTSTITFGATTRQYRPNPIGDLRVRALSLAKKRSFAFAGPVGAVRWGLGTGPPSCYCKMESTVSRKGVFMRCQNRHWARSSSVALCCGALIMLVGTGCSSTGGASGTGTGGMDSGGQGGIKSSGGSIGSGGSAALAAT